MVRSQTNRYDPDYVSHPGATLRDLLDERDLSQAELAIRMGRPQKTISEIVNGKTAITPETALELEMVLGVPARFWNTREQHFREFIARQQRDSLLADQYAWACNFPLKEMTDLGFIPKVKEPSDQARYVLQYLGVSSPDQWSEVYNQCEVAFRRSSSFEANEYSLGAWLRAGVVKASEIRLESYDKARFLSALKNVRSLTRQKPSEFQHELKALCAEAGVAVAFVPQLPKSFVSGATRWLSSSHALIQLSMRYKTNDHLWFTFFHEAAHVLFHEKRAIFLDTADKEGEKELAANSWAADFLVPKKEYETFVVQRSFNKTDIIEFANRIEIAPGIVVGRLQHDGHLPFSHCNGLKMRLAWSEGNFFGRAD